MNGFLRVGALALIGIAAVVFYVATFVVQQTQSAIVLRFGAVRSVVTAPGLYFKLPAPFEQEVFNRMLAEMLADDAARAEWGANGLAFADTADLYSMPQRAADVILAERA